MRTSETEMRAARAGFTLIEILLVVVIIGMLATVAAINIPRILDDSRITRAKADISRINTALHAYNMAMGKYPGSLEALTTGEDPVMDSIPADPWGHEYQYAIPGSHGRALRFDLSSSGPDGVPSDDDIGNWNLDRTAAARTP